MARRRNEFDASVRDIVARHVDGLAAEITNAVRRNLAQELRTYLGGGGSVTLGGRKRKQRDMGCIAPKCKNRSKGPRFHYLCDKHADAPKKMYDKWRAEQPA